MPTIDLGPLGAVLSPAEAGFAETAGELERLGYSTVWLTGGPMTSLSQVADAVRATTRVRIATGIIPVDAFGADGVASLYGELEDEQPGRFVVGLGGAHGPEPLTTLNTYLDRLDRPDGVPRDRRIMAALGPRMLGLARERAAGALPVLVTPEYVARARRELGPDSTLAVEQLVVLETDADRARGLARGPLGFLGQVPAYQASFRRMGFAAEDIDSLGDALVDGLVAWGDGAALAERVAALREAGAEHVAVSVVADGDPTLDQWATVLDAVS